MLGDLFEGFAFDLMRRAGFPVIEQQVQMEDRQMKLTGHADATSAFMDDPLNPFVVEIKSAHPNIWSQINSVDDLKKKPWLKKYPAQLQVYMFIKGYKRGVILFVNKSTGQIKEIWMDLDLNIVAEIENKCKRINFAVDVYDLAKTDAEKEAVMPERIKNISTCEMCSFRHICRPDTDFGSPLKISDDPEFDLKVKRMVEARAMTKEMEALEKQIKGLIKATADGDKLENIKLLSGGTMIQGKKDAKGAWRITFEGDEE
jgi:hypothetical protein